MNILCYLTTLFVDKHGFHMHLCILSRCMTSVEYGEEAQPGLANHKSVSLSALPDGVCPLSICNTSWHAAQ